MLTCVHCGATSTGDAWHWIAILCRIPGGAEAACYCPVCAESEFAHFSKQCVRRLELSEDPHAE
jgi:hypothetical protein